MSVCMACRGVGRGGVFRGVVVAFFVGVWVGMFFCFRASVGWLGVLPLGVPWARAYGWRVSWVGCGRVSGWRFRFPAHRFKEETPAGISAFAQRFKESGLS